MYRRWNVGRLYRAFEANPRKGGPLWSIADFVCLFRTFQCSSCSLLQHSFIPRQCQGAALLILTGDVTFIENICDKAHRLALHFNEYGLWKWCDEERWDFLHGDSEEKIFRDLGMEYILPDRRNFAFLSTDRRRNRPRKKIGLCKPVNNNSDRGGNTGDHKG